MTQYDPGPDHGGRRTLEELIAEQRVEPITSADELAGERLDDEEFAAFYAVIRSCREPPGIHRACP